MGIKFKYDFLRTIEFYKKQRYLKFSSLEQQ